MYVCMYIVSTYFNVISETVRYMPDRENAVDISERLCVENAGQYGGLCMYTCMCM